MWKAGELIDRAQILAYLQTDRLYAAYAIGDLEPGMFEQCAWAGAETMNRLQALVLLFRGLEPPALFLMGHSGGLAAVLQNVPFPNSVYLTCREDHLALTRDFYRWEQTIPMWRMVLPPEHFRPAQGDCSRLRPSLSDQLAKLYALGGGGAFDLTQMQHGTFYGVLVDGQLVAVAGTHLVSPTYGVAAVGNVFTHPSYRGQGYGTATTSAVVAELLRRGIRDVILNVGQDNTAAIRIYERLGFARYCAFLEGPASYRSRADRRTKGPEVDNAYIPRP
jgi:ribosomal protein S18 acetylase RimI-like enzyme